jgi:Ser/Thr protein kinase RdoA (MazF antagonist)
MSDDRRAVALIDFDVASPGSAVYDGAIMRIGPDATRCSSRLI